MDPIIKRTVAVIIALRKILVPMSKKNCDGNICIITLEDGNCHWPVKRSKWKLVKVLEKLNFSDNVISVASASVILLP
jgi:hypothetical protein